MSKTYKGYELIKAIDDGEIKEGTQIEVHSLKVADNIITTIKYTNKRLEWATGEFDTSCLVDNDYYFKVLEDEIDIQNIEELNLFDNGQGYSVEDSLDLIIKSYDINFQQINDTFNKVIRAVKQLDRKRK